MGLSLSGILLSNEADWKAWIQSDRPDRSPHPEIKDIDPSLHYAIKLALLKTIRPDLLLTEIESEMLKLLCLPHAIAPSLNTVLKELVPVTKHQCVILCENDGESHSLTRETVTLANTSNLTTSGSFEILDASRVSWSSVERRLAEAATRGGWVLLKSFELSTAPCTKLSAWLQSPTHFVNKDFRLVISLSKSSLERTSPATSSEQNANVFLIANSFMITENRPTTWVSYMLQSLETLGYNDLRSNASLAGTLLRVATLHALLNFRDQVLDKPWVQGFPIGRDCCHAVKSAIDRSTGT